MCCWSWRPRIPKSEANPGHPRHRIQSCCACCQFRYWIRGPRLLQVKMKNTWFSRWAAENLGLHHSVIGVVHSPKTALQTMLNKFFCKVEGHVAVKCILEVDIVQWLPSSPWTKIHLFPSLVQIIWTFKIINKIRNYIIWNKGAATFSSSNFSALTSTSVEAAGRSIDQNVYREIWATNHYCLMLYVKCLISKN